MSEKNAKAKMTLESLFAAQTHISQLGAENVLLRQLRVDLDSSSKDCTLLRRQVSTLEAELTKYRSNGTQIQPNMIGNGGQIWDAHTNPQSLRQSFQPLLDNTGRRADPTVPTVRPEATDEQDRDRDRGQRLSRHLTPSVILRDNGTYQQEQQSVVKRSNGNNSISSSSSSSGAPLSSFISPSAHLQHRASNMRGEGDFDTLSYSPSSGEVPVNDLDLDNRKVLPLYPVQQSLSLADIVGIRRGSTTSLDPSLIPMPMPSQSQRSSLGALISPAARSSSSSSGNREDEQHRIESAVSNVHYSNTMTIPSLQVSRRCTVHESGSYRGSGGGVSSFYDDLEPSAGPPIAPFGTSQSVLSSMAVYDETDRHLTALMTEKASLNEESSRLLQRGGKVLRERTRIQHIDARLGEIGKEIAHERKKLSGKPG